MSVIKINPDVFNRDKKRVYEATASNFGILSGKTEEKFSIWFEYKNRFGRISSTPALSLPKECMQSLAKYWLENGIIKIEDIV